MESVKQAVNYVAESVQGAASGVSKETNKEVAKDSNAPVSTRANAAFDAVGDKIDQSTHENKAQVHKEIAKN
ncbi:glucose-repressible protein Grg1 [Dactylonectria estremocensis]|uniref:Glucose-repressible protein Grg1 n=1 Tax=Dactylonectria estremocensis TaxID=1079267 RepID=A0A9P9FBR7_9HYPO|nr:glucose-repressible protein Grg1 [Dactylonectria estremocensis]